MCAQRLIIAETDADRLVAAVHRHEVEIEINQQVAFGGATVDAQRFFVSRLAEQHKIG